MPVGTARPALPDLPEREIRGRRFRSGAGRFLRRETAVMATNDCLKNVLDKAYEDKPLKEVIKASPAALQGVSEKDAKALKEAFGIDTIEEFANSKFVKWAQALVALAAAEK